MKSGWDQFLNQLAFGDGPFTMPVMPGLALPATGDGRREHLPYVKRAVDLNARRLELYNLKRPLTPEEWAEFSAPEIRWAEQPANQGSK